MTNIGESIAVSAVKKLDDEPCWYCEEPQVTKKTNQLAADPQASDDEDEDEVPENDDVNDSSALGSHLGDRPEKTLDCPHQKKQVAVILAAHHCIPGNGSLKPAMESGLEDFMNEGGEFSLNSDIGYNVNHRNNGVWLPGNYAVRKDKNGYSSKWGRFGKKFKDEYAKRAMEKTSGLQFHDAHSKYNGKVKKTLESVTEKMGEPDKKCPICNKDFDSQRPPFGLVGRLDAVSGDHRTMISNIDSPRAKEYVNAGYYTSSRVKTYFGIV